MAGLEFFHGRCTDHQLALPGLPINITYVIRIKDLGRFATMTFLNARTGPERASKRIMATEILAGCGDVRRSLTAFGGMLLIKGVC